MLDVPAPDFFTVEPPTILVGISPKNHPEFSLFFFFIPLKNHHKKSLRTKHFLEKEIFVEKSFIGDPD